MKDHNNNEEVKVPRDNEAERALLASVILDPVLIQEAQDLLVPEDFFSSSHRRIFEAMKAIADRGNLVDFITLQSELSQNNELEAVGGGAYLADMITGAVRTDHIKDYASIILRTAQKRRLMRAGKSIAASALDGEENGTELLLKARKLVDDVGFRIESDGFTDIGILADQELDRLEDIGNHQGALIGVPSGFVELDRLLCGFQENQLIILAARPGVGKSAFAVCVAENAASKNKKIGFFSLEMSKRELVSRLLCGMARVDSHKARSGYLSREDWARFAQARQRMSGWSIKIDDSATSSIPVLRSKARRLKAEHGLDLMIVDYLQKIDGSNIKQSREQEIAEVSRGLKTIAQELRIPVLALCQINRAAENRAEHRPQLSDLRESGSLEADADVVLLLYRAELYRDTATEENKGIAEMIIAKQRNGPTDTVNLAFIKEYTRFEELWQER